MFRRLQATYPGVYIQNKGRHLARVLALSQSPYACYVCHVEVGFDSPWRASPEYQEYLRDLAVLLPLCLSHFPNVTTLSVRGPIYSRGISTDVPFPQELSILLTKSVVDALRYVPLPKLRDLSLSFPITIDYGQFLRDQVTPWRIPIKQVLQQLEHLSVEICDTTGTRRYHEVPLSAAKSASPNEHYAFHMFKIIELAENLTFLSIWVTDDLNLVNLDTSKLNKLQALQLRGISSSAEKLLSFIEPSKETLTRLEFELIKLNRGTWQDVLFCISRLATSLVFFQMQSNGYSKTGGSAHLCPEQLPSANDPRPVETTEALDYHALGDVQRLVNGNRRAAGLLEMEKNDYMLLGISPLEDIIRFRAER